MKLWMMTAAALLAACTADGRSVNSADAQETAATQGKARHTDALRGQWRLVAVDGAAVAAEINAHLDLSNLPDAGGHLGCNRLMFRLIVEGDKLAADGGVIATKKMCQPERMRYENQLTAALYQKNLRYRIEGGTMVWEIPDRLRFEFQRR